MSNQQNDHYNETVEEAKKEHGREIKFRAWDKKEKMMFHNPEFKGVGHTLNDIFNIKAFEWMQFTGLLDKFGKEIYEDDIVVRPHGGNDGVVTWFRGGYWGVVVEDDYWNYMFDTNSPEKHEVIGNIYENPELLKV